MINTYNPLLEEQIKRYNKLPKEIKIKLELANKEDYQLERIKRKRPRLKKGDIFLLCPTPGLYFYGKVFEVDIDHVLNDLFIQGKNVVFIFKNKTNEISMKDYNPDYSDLLIEPNIVDISYWNQGYFYNVGNIELSQEEVNLDYGFFSDFENKPKFCMANGIELNHKPKILGLSGITTIIGIARKIRREFIIDSEILGNFEIRGS